MVPVPQYLYPTQMHAVKMPAFSDFSHLYDQTKVTEDSIIDRPGPWYNKNIFI